MTIDYTTKKPVISLMGPTASGKTQLAMALAHEFSTQIISVDSVMVYKGLDIGSAKPTMVEREGIKHHLIDVCDPDQPYSAGQFCIDAKRCIDELLGAGKIPILAGGSMLYHHALQRGLAKLPTANPSIRAQILDEASTHGWDWLYLQLQQVDPKAAKRIHANDQQRIQRALEVYRASGTPISKHQQQTTAPLADYTTYNFVLLPTSKEQLREIIAKRFDAMLDKGLIDEVNLLYKNNKLNIKLPAIRAVGYQQVWRYLAGEYSIDTMRERAIIATCQLAKHQMTWLNRWVDAIRLTGDLAENVAVIEKTLAG